jgi:uncharacterized protein YecT (DUF1311 family)
MRSYLVASVVFLAVPLAPTVRAQIDCAAASTQADINRCAYEAFLAAADEQARAVRDLEARLSPAQQKAFRAAQAAWRSWRGAQCEFESSASANGSARPLVQWTCAARLTRARNQELVRLASCPEGDLGCPLRPR